VHASLNQQFPNQWIGHAGPISWPARSPSVTPCGFFPMQIHKILCVQTPVADINNLKDRITAGIASCLGHVTNGVHVECVQCSEQTSRVSPADDAQTVCICIFVKILFTSKVVKIIYVNPVC
jgi:hypothetical protein